MPDATFADWISNIKSLLEENLSINLPSEQQSPNKLHQAMRYVMLGGGKRIRPLLVFAAGELVGAKQEHLLNAACTIEIIHTYSLVHDDLPCMDDDILRRGKATCHVQFDEATALLVGDALQCMAFELLAKPMPGLATATQMQMIQVLSNASGHHGMAAGQAIDLDSVGKKLNIAELEYMHCLKTGKLIHAAVQLGVLCGRKLNAAENQQVNHFAKHIGLLFQVIDDILDYASDSETLGKTAGKDRLDNKPTYVSLLGLAPARELAKDLYHSAIDALSIFGQNNKRLLELSNYIVERSF